MVYLFPKAAVTNHDKPGDLKQQKFILLLFSRPEVPNQGIIRAVHPLMTPSLPLLTYGDPGGPGVPCPVVAQHQCLPLPSRGLLSVGLWGWVTFLIGMAVFGFRASLSPYDLILT